MTAGRRGVGLTPMETRRDVIVRAAVLADELGYEVFAVPEGWGLDSTPVLAEIALRTTRIHLASGVLSVWGRTPVTLAMTAATLHQACGGRYVLGLGASTKALPEGFHGTPFDHPAAKLRDVVAKVRALLAGQPAQLHHTPAARPLRLGRPLAPEVPIWVAALGDHTARVAAELGDGWIPALVARDHLPAWTAQLNELRATTTPHAKALTVAAGPITAVDEDAGAARGIAAGCTAWYVSAMGEVYARSVSGNGYAAQVQAIIAANPRPSPRRGTVPPGAQAVLGQLAAYGTCDQVREQLHPGGALAAWVDTVTGWLSRFGVSPESITDQLRAGAGEIASRSAGWAGWLASGTLTMLLGLLFALLAMHAVLRHWPRIVTALAAAAPLRPEYTRQLLGEFRRVGRMTLNGTVLTGLAQGTLATIGFTITGVPHPLFFGAATALASLVPAVGTLLVWVPAGIYLFATGQVARAVVALAWGAVVVVGFSDYVIRPRLVGDEAMPAVLTFIALFGGLEVMGLPGLVVGPVVMALAVAALRLYAHEARSRRAPKS